MAHARHVDDQLEAMRNEIEGPPNLDLTIIHLKRLGSKVHAGFLFETNAIPLLKQICLLISATPTGPLHSGWQEFGAQLGITREQLQCIEYDFKGLQDPTYYVLLTFIQGFDASIEKIVEALENIKRLDIINRISKSLAEFLNTLTSNITENNGILRTHYTPRAPLVLSPVIFPENTPSNAPTRQLTSPQPNSSTDSQSSTKKKYGSIVMLTFAEDGRETAMTSAKVFRSKEPRVGVVILQEQEKFVYSRAEAFVDDCFKQVDYIVPILTKKYIDRINNVKENYYQTEENSLDLKYLNYVYSLMRFEYAKSRCTNNRVRCLVPDNEVSTVIKSDLHPTLQAWFRVSDIDNFVSNILLKKF